MPDPAAPATSPIRKAAGWLALIVLSAIFVAVLEWLRLPAALLLAPMAAAVVLAAKGLTLRLPRAVYLPAQAIVGCMIARSIAPSTVGVLGAHWPLFLATILSVIAVSSALGWLLARWQVLPGSAAIWGSSPGAATAMTLMAAAHGADLRLVAFMQYLRVVLVALTATLVARFWVGAHGDPVAVTWFPALDGLSFVETLVLAVFGGFLGRRLKIPAGSLLVPLVAGAVLHGSGLMEIELPPWLLAPSYALIGWNIGLSFTPAILAHVARAFPKVAAASLVQIAICAGLAVLLNRFAGIDPLSAYLATSPGGADSVAIIAASSKVDIAFVMAMQTGRLILVILISPSLARFLVRRLDARTGQPPKAYRRA